MNKEKLKFYDIWYIFLFGTFFGWIVEGIWTYVKKGQIINHSGLVIGPFNLIYGIGAIFLTIMLFKLRKSNIFKIFIVSFITGTILEYAISLFMEYTVGFAAWTYKYKPYNINGRICLAYSIFWGILGIIWIKIIYPKLQEWINKTDHKTGTKLMYAMIIFMILDVFLTYAAIYRGKKYEQNIPPSNKFEEVLDDYFGVNYLNNMFNNRWNKK